MVKFSISNAKLNFAISHKKNLKLIKVLNIYYIYIYNLKFNNLYIQFSFYRLKKKNFLYLKLMGVQVIGREDTVKCPALLTPWSIIHFCFGIYCGWIIYPLLDPTNHFMIGFILFSMIHLLYEFKDVYISLRRKCSSQITPPPSFMQKIINSFNSNSLENSVTDQLVSMVGYLVGYALFIMLSNSVKWSVFVSIVFFFLLGIFITYISD